MYGTRCFWTLSHIIDGKDHWFSSPRDIAFDLSGDVHVVGYSSRSIKVFSSDGQFVREYGEVKNPNSIAIDSAGYSLVTNWASRSLSIFNPSGTFIHSAKELANPYGVSVSPDGSIWVAYYKKDITRML